VLDRRALLRGAAGATAGAALVRSGLGTSAAAAGASFDLVPRGAWAQRAPGPGVAHTINRLSVHHTASSSTDNRRTPGQLRSVESYHRSQGWPDVAYHLFIGPDGSVYEGRDRGIRGDTFTSYDPTGHLLVCCVGNYESQTLGAETFESLARVLAWGASTYGVEPGAIAGHRAYASTACPGRNLQPRIDDGSLVARVRALVGGGGVTLRALSLDEGRRRVAAIEGGVAPRPPRAIAIAAAGSGYRVARDDGRVLSFGVADHGDQAGTRLAAPVVAMASTPSGEGCWLAAADGGVFCEGDAAFAGSAGAIRLVRPIVGMASTPSGRGYWLVASDGGVFAYGDARFAGSTGGMRINRPVVGIATTPRGDGYWLVASDGGVFAFGGATFCGSAGGSPLNRPVVGIAATRSGNGYWLVADDGGIFAYGDAPFVGSAGGARLVAPVTGMGATPSGRGYWLAADDGGVFAYGDAPFLGAATDVDATAAAAACC
jgi:hypothetical protein